MAKLVFIAKGKPQEITLGQELTIGRGYSNLLRLDGDEISRVHAIIYRHGEGYLLRDLDSKNGVFVNGLKVLTTELKAGDAIQIGKFGLHYDPPAGEVNVGAGAGDDFAPVEDEFAKSQLFSGSPVKAAPVVEQAAVGLQDEVTLMTRAEVAELINHGDESLPPGVVELESECMRRVLGALAATDGQAVESLAEVILNALTSALEASGGVIVRRGMHAGAFSPVAITPAGADVAVNRVVMREGFSEGRAVLCPVTGDCGLFRDSATVLRDRIYTLLSVPLAGLDGEAGLLYVDRKGDDAEPFLLADMVVAARIARLLERHLFESGSHVTPAQGVLE